MTEAKWDLMLSTIVEIATNEYNATSESEKVLTLLIPKGVEGVSFSELRNESGINPSSLNRCLTSLVGGGLVENYLQRKAESREYSFYRITPVGHVVLDETLSMKRLLKAKIELKLRRISKKLNETDSGYRLSSSTEGAKTVLRRVMESYSESATYPNFERSRRPRVVKTESLWRDEITEEEPEHEVIFT